MAAPIAHIFLAVQMLAGPFSGMFNEKEFIIGTSFPDIRYLKVVGRGATHFSNVTLEEILQEQDSFKAGMLFHSFVDEQREAYVVAHGFYAKLSTFRFVTQSLKFAEDEILKARFDSTLYQHYFDDIVEGELGYNIDEQDIRAWHVFLQEYFKGSYSGKDLVMKFFDLNEPDAFWGKRWLFSWIYARKMQQVMLYIMENKQLNNLILSFYGSFSKKFTQK